MWKTTPQPTTVKTQNNTLQMQQTSNKKFDSLHSPHIYLSFSNLKRNHRLWQDMEIKKYYFFYKKNIKFQKISCIFATVFNLIDTMYSNKWFFHR